MNMHGGAGPPWPEGGGSSQNDRARRSSGNARPKPSQQPGGYNAPAVRSQASRLSPEASRRAAAYLAPQQSARAVIRRWQTFRNAAGTICGFIDVEFASGLIINGCKLMRGSAGRYWVAPPAVQQRDKDGAIRLDAGGKATWEAVVAFASREARDRFNEAVLAALRQQHPEALSS